MAHSPSSPSTAGSLDTPQEILSWELIQTRLEAMAVIYGEDLDFDLLLESVQEKTLQDVPELGITVDGVNLALTPQQHGEDAVLREELTQFIVRLEAVVARREELCRAVSPSPGPSVPTPSVHGAGPVTPEQAQERPSRREWLQRSVRSLKYLKQCEWNSIRGLEKIMQEGKVTGEPFSFPYTVGVNGERKTLLLTRFDEASMIEDRVESFIIEVFDSIRNSEPDFLDSLAAINARLCQLVSRPEIQDWKRLTEIIEALHPSIHFRELALLNVDGYVDGYAEAIDLNNLTTAQQLNGLIDYLQQKVEERQKIEQSLERFDALNAEGRIQIERSALNDPRLDTDEKILAFVRHQIKCGRGGKIEADTAKIKIIFNGDDYFWLGTFNTEQKNGRIVLFIKDRYFPPAPPTPPLHGAGPASAELAQEQLERPHAMEWVHLSLSALKKVDLMGLMELKAFASELEAYLKSPDRQNKEFKGAVMGTPLFIEAGQNDATLAKRWTRFMIQLFRNNNLAGSNDYILFKARLYALGSHPQLKEWPTLRRIADEVGEDVEMELQVDGIELQILANNAYVPGKSVFDFIENLTEQLEEAKRPAALKAEIKESMENFGNLIMNKRSYFDPSCDRIRDPRLKTLEGLIDFIWEQIEQGTYPLKPNTHWINISYNSRQNALFIVQNDFSNQRTLTQELKLNERYFPEAYQSPEYRKSRLLCRAAEALRPIDPKLSDALNEYLDEKCFGFWRPAVQGVPIQLDSEDKTMGLSALNNNVTQFMLALNQAFHSPETDDDRDFLAVKRATLYTLAASERWEPFSDPLKALADKLGDFYPSQIEFHRDIGPARLHIEPGWSKTQKKQALFDFVQVLSSLPTSQSHSSAPPPQSNPPIATDPDYDEWVTQSLKL